MRNHLPVGVILQQLLWNLGKGRGSGPRGRGVGVGGTGRQNINTGKKHPPARFM